MKRLVLGCVAVSAFGIATDGAFGQWVEFTNETGSRLIADSARGANDTQEKDYAWGDVDQDGDMDLVVARKEPFTTPGRRQNVFFRTEGTAEGRPFDGMLVDRSNDYVSLSDDGSSGFMDETNDRDIALVDVDLDGWLDIVTATAYGQGLPKTISHSRIYMNLGEVDGVWQGFEYQEARIPQLSQAPNTCAVGTGDVTGDGYPDLYYVVYNSSGLQDHLLVNQGALNPGFFVNESFRLTNEMLSSGFGTGGEIVDMNNDTFRDIVKSQAGPVEIFYNNGLGFFNQLDPVSSGAHYFFSTGDLNDDGLPDLIISDDGSDRYRINLGNGGDGLANFNNNTFSFVGGGTDLGFNGNSATADLNNDGFNDELITDVDVDAGGCGRRMNIFRNLGNLPNPTMQEQMQSGSVAGIPTGMLTGTHDVAVYDINGDGWKDLVIGRCSGTQIWMNLPPVGLIFSYPNGLPVQLPPDETFDIQVGLEAVGDAEIEPGSGRMFYSVDGGDFQEQVMVEVGENLLQGTFPALPCTSEVQFYFRAALDPGGQFTDPPSAPGGTYSAVASLGTETIINDEIEEDVSDWIVITEGKATTGTWEQAEPLPTIFNGQLAAPDEDASAGHEKVKAFVTLNSDNPQEPSESDVDEGPVHLISPVLDLAGTDASISFARWFVSDGGGLHVPDFLTVDISHDGGETWVPMPELTTGGTDHEWESVSFDVASYIEPTSEVRLRFTTSDLPNNSVTEAGIDDLRVDVLDCGEEPACPADLDGNSTIDVDDLVALILDWGCLGAECLGDVDGNGEVDVDDLVALVLAWGDCP